MRIFDRMIAEGHEQLIFCRDASGLKTIIAIHDTTLGPALGGCRMWPYETEDAAIDDALRLSRGMTYKSAASGQNHGGGKAVIWGDPKTEKSEELFRALGRFVGGLRGRFVTGTDVGTVSSDFVWAAQESPYFVALPEEYGGSGDSSIITAYGVWLGVKACAQEVWGSDSLAGKRVAVQGVGKVGRHLVDHLVEDGAQVTVADIVEDNVSRVLARHPGVRRADPQDILFTPCDIVSPCALGGVLNDDTIPRLNCRVVAGSANNQLREERHGAMLHDRGILYAPDFVINSGGLIQVADELLGYDRERAYRKTAQIGEMLRRIFAIARRDSIPSAQAARVMAEERIEKVGRLARIYQPE